MFPCSLLRRTYRSILLAIFMSLLMGIFIGYTLHSSLGQLEKREPNHPVSPREESQGPEFPKEKFVHPKEQYPPAVDVEMDQPIHDKMPLPFAEVHTPGPSVKADGAKAYLRKLSKEWKKTPLPNYNVHMFYYIWYGNPAMNGHYLHWNHKRIPHWDKNVAHQHPQHGHTPPDDIASNFYPLLGTYSSSDSAVIHKHMQMVRASGVGVLVVSWLVPSRADANGAPVDFIIKPLLDIAYQYNISICFHLEPYPGRTVTTVRDDIVLASRKYTDHPAYHRRRREPGMMPLPVFYVYDSYLIGPDKWARLLHKGTHMTIRETEFDAYMVGLFLNAGDCNKLKGGGFDAAYTYFASPAVSFASLSSNWVQISGECSQQNVTFSPSLGPGYVDTAVRPWNAISTIQRRRGAVYRREFWRAMKVIKSIKKGIRPFWSITSFNEWHEGSQIEPAVTRPSYLDYSPNHPDFYLRLTAKMVHQFSDFTRFHNVTLPVEEQEQHLEEGEDTR